MANAMDWKPAFEASRWDPDDKLWRAKVLALPVLSPPPVAPQSCSMLCVRRSLKPIAIQMTFARPFEEQEEAWIWQMSSFDTLKHMNATKLLGRGCHLGTWDSLRSGFLF